MISPKKICLYYILGIYIIYLGNKEYYDSRILFGTTFYVLAAIVLAVMASGFLSYYCYYINTIFHVNTILLSKFILWYPLGRRPVA